MNSAQAAPSAGEASLARRPSSPSVRGMDTVLPLDRMTVEEKLRVMEALWTDLSRKADAFESPAWHGEVIRERDLRVAEGKETYLNWEDAKRELRDRLL